MIRTSFDDMYDSVEEVEFLKELMQIIMRSKDNGDLYIVRNKTE